MLLNQLKAASSGSRLRAPLISSSEMQPSELMSSAVAKTKLDSIGGRVALLLAANEKTIRNQTDI